MSMDRLRVLAILALDNSRFTTSEISALLGVEETYVERVIEEMFIHEFGMNIPCF